MVGGIDESNGERGEEPNGGGIAEVRDGTVFSEMEVPSYLLDIVESLQPALITSLKTIRAVKGKEARGVTIGGSSIG